LHQDFTVDFLPNPGTIGGTKIVTINITKASMQASTNNGLAQVNVCFEAPFMFPVKPGTPALQLSEPGVFRGLLPDCGDPTCVAECESVAGGARIVVQAPGGNQDPRYGPYSPGRLFSLSLSLSLGRNHHRAPSPSSRARHCAADGRHRDLRARSARG